MPNGDWTRRQPVLSTVLNQKPPLLEPKPAKTRPKNFYQKNHHNFRPNRHNFRNFEVEKLNFLQIPLMFTEKCENIAFFLPAPKNFFRHKKVPNRQKPANPPLLPTLLKSSVARTFFLEITDVRPKKNEKNGGKSPKKRRKNEFQPQISQILTLPTFFIAFLYINFFKS